MLKHKHLLITAYVNSPPISEEDGVRWLKELVTKIDMEVFMEPVCKYCNDPDNLGLTGVIGLTTSHISFHAWNKTTKVKQAFINADVYSCKDFDPNTVIDHFREFDLVDLDWKLIDRDPR